MRDSIMEDQDDLIVRKPECDEVGSEVNARAASSDPHQITGCRA